MQTRKQFLRNALAITTGTLFTWKGIESFAETPKNESIYFDFHSHPGWSLGSGSLTFDSGEPLNKTIREMGEGHLTGTFITLIADAPFLKLGTTGINISGKYASGEGWTEYKRQLRQLKDAYAKVSVKLSMDISDLNPENKNVIGYIAVEGGDFLDGQIKHIEESYQDGVRSIQLVHYVPNDVGDLQTSEHTFNGLSLFGKETVKKMNELGMAIDVAHASYATTKDVASLTKAPIILSHSILEMEADRPIAKRAISKEHAKLVAGTGGVIGAWPSGFNKSFDEFTDNIKRLVDVVGIDHVGIGTDMDGNFKPVLSSYTQFPPLAETLQSKGFSKKETGKIMGENAKVVLGKIFKSK